LYTNSQDETSGFHVVTTHVTVSLKQHFQTKAHVTNFKGRKNSFVPAIKPRAKYVFHTHRILTFYKNITLMKVVF
jgi:hypothetical protein